MSGPISLWKARHRESNFLSCALQLCAAVLVAFTLAAPLAYWWSGGGGISDLALATSINLTLGLASLALMLFFIYRNRPLEGMLLSMGLRMVPPLALCLWLATTGAEQRNILFISSLIFSYLVVLGTETFLTVRAAKATQNL